MRSPVLALVLVLLAPLAVTGPGAADAGLTVRVLHDLHPDGLAFVGNLAHFGFLILDEAGEPSRHHDVALTLRQNGVVLFESEAVHDYDGVGGFDYTFTQAGRFTVTVTVDGEAALSDSFSGNAVRADGPYVELTLEAPATATAGEPAAFRYAMHDMGTGAIMPHKDTLVEVRRALDDVRVLSTHTHTHENLQEFRYAFPSAGEYVVTLTAFDAFPRPDSDAVATRAVAHRVTVGPGAAADPAALPTPGTPESTPAEEPGAYRLVFTSDPDAMPGPFTFHRASAIVVDVANGTTLQHVDFTARVVDPLGNTVFESETLHEYDGVFELAGTFATPGAYAMHVTASYRDWSAEGVARWTVVPPAVPLGPGTFEATLTGADGARAGLAAHLEVALEDPATGRPWEHAEVDARVSRAGEAAPLALAKLHTHGDGRFPFTFTFPDAGEYDVHVDATPTTASASQAAARTFRVSVADGPGLPAAADVGGDGKAALDVPAPALALVAVALVAAAVARKR